MLKDMSITDNWKGRKILFVHTGGLLGLYDKVDQLSAFVATCRRMSLQELLTL